MNGCNPEQGAKTIHIRKTGPKNDSPGVKPGQVPAKSKNFAGTSKLHLRALDFGIIPGWLFPLVGVCTNKIWGFNLIVGEDTNDGESCGKGHIGIGNFWPSNPITND